jgi:hypothetical protein
MVEHRFVVPDMRVQFPLAAPPKDPADSARFFDNLEIVIIE